jgi:signal transduction histidine kinase
MLNLLSNAIRFTFQGGITVAVSKEFHLDDHEIISDRGKLLEIRVSDSGIGLTEE